MTDRILSEEEVATLEGFVQTFNRLIPTEAMSLITSHRLLAAEVSHLENGIEKTFMKILAAMEEGARDQRAALEIFRQERTTARGK